MKTKTALKKISKYIRELSIVVVGIAITFTISNWISGQKEKKDLSLYLSAVKIELEDNLESIQKYALFYGQVKQLAHYLSSVAPETIQTDTIQGYVDIMGQLSFLTYKTSAFEMFKASGTMRFVEDKSLMQTIWNSYDALERIKLAHEFYMQQKMNLLQNNDTSNLDFKDTENKIVRFFSQDFGMKEGFDSCAQTIQETLSRF